MAVPLKQPITWDVWTHCDLYPSHLLEGAVVQLHIWMSIEPYSVLHSLLTAAYGKAIFIRCVRGGGTDLTITWRRQQLWNRIDEELEPNREQIVSSHPIDTHYTVSLLLSLYTVENIWNTLELYSGAYKLRHWTSASSRSPSYSFSMILMTVNLEWTIQEQNEQEV